MASKTEIIDMALSRLGEDAIMDPDENSNRSRALELVYPVLRDVSLRRHPWDFARELAALQPDGTAPAFGYAYRYRLPSSPWCLKALEVEDEASYPWRRFGRHLHSDRAAPLKLTYTKRVTQEGDFDPDFLTVFALELAIWTAKKLTNSSGLAEKLREEQRALMAEARSVESQEARRPPLPMGRYRLARLGG